MSTSPQQKEAEMETEEPLRGDALLIAVWNQIFEHPETHDQGAYRDVTQHTFTGWVQVLGGVLADHTSVEEDTQKLLGISRFDAEWLGCVLRTRRELFLYVQQRIAMRAVGFDRDDYNRYGYDRYGRSIEVPKIEPCHLELDSPPTEGGCHGN